MILRALMWYGVLRVYVWMIEAILESDELWSRCQCSYFPDRLCPHCKALMQALRGRA